MSNSLNTNIILTISILSGGQSEYLEKCLKSLDSLRSKVPSELIIIDTGCGAAAKAINEKYADLIIPYEWNNDFASARNVGVDNSHGKYYMFLDDDEWFEDTFDIEQFFIKGDYKKFESAFYIARNYDDKEGTRFSDEYVSRLFTLEKEIRFKSRIHEYPNPLIGKQLRLSSFVHHYGYAFDANPEARITKSKRNIDILNQMIVEEPDNIRHWAHLAVEYKSLRDYGNLYLICDRGIRKCCSKEDHETKRYIATLYVGRVLALIGLGKSDDAILNIMDALKANIFSLPKAQLYALWVQILYNKSPFSNRNYDECAIYCREYLDIYEKEAGNKDMVFSQFAFFCDNALEYSVAAGVLSTYTICLLRKGDVEEAYKYFNIYDFTRADIIIAPDTVDQIITGMAINQYHPIFTQMLKVMLSRKGIDYLTIEAFKKVLTNPNVNESTVALINKLPDDVLYRNELLSLSEQTELLLLSQKLKGKIMELMNMGLYKESMAICEQLSDLTPDDKELLELKSKIYKRLHQ